VFWRKFSTGANVIWKSANHLTPQAVAPVRDPLWLPVAAGDFDGDGKADIFWHHWGTGANVVWPSAMRSMRLARQPVPDHHWQVVGSGDFDGDGKTDVLWRNLGNANGPGTGENVIWKSSNGATQQAVHAVHPAWEVMPWEGTVGIFF
jgi:hypothetical protein